MSELKATPGPWEVNKYGDVVVKGSGAIVGYPPENGCIASLSVGEYIKNQKRHDAHLIAAAPELYEALEAMLNDGVWVGGEWITSDDARNKAHDALEKARGEQ